MNAARKIWAAGWRVVVCVLLLLWIFHTIFLQEGRLAAEAQHLDWNSLSRWEQARQGWHFGPPELWRKLSLIHPALFALSALVMGTTLLLGVVRWRMVLRVHGLLLPWNRALEISLVAHFFNSFLLGSTGGDLMKAYYAARATRHKKTEAVVTVFADRLIGLWAMLLFATLMMFPNARLLLDQQRLRAPALLVLGMMAACSLLVALAFRGGLSRRWSGARDWLRRLPKGPWLERSLESCRRFGRERFFLARTLSISMLLNLACVLQVWVLSRGLHLRIDLLVLLVIVPTIICISALPITPSGLGVRENLFVLTLASPALAVSATAALSLSLLAYAGSLLWSLLGGIVYLTLKQRRQFAIDDLEPDLDANA